MSDYELTYNDYDSREKILPERDKAYTCLLYTSDAADE